LPSEVPLQSLDTLPAERLAAACDVQRRLRRDGSFVLSAGTPPRDLQAVIDLYERSLISIADVAGDTSLRPCRPPHPCITVAAEALLLSLTRNDGSMPLSASVFREFERRLCIPELHVHAAADYLCEHGQAEMSVAPGEDGEQVDVLILIDVESSLVDMLDEAAEGGAL
jgi:hypothetical protein